jgi:tetratricopeptide (TPR) repeat protein
MTIKHICRPASFAVLAIITLCVLTYCQSADAEGFPGKGNRMLYADALPHYNLGNKYLAKEWYEKAVEKYLDAINIYPYDADVYTNLAVAYRKMDNLAGAEEASRKAVELNDSDWTGWSNLGNMLMAQEKFPEAYKCFVRAMKCTGIPAEEKTHMESNIDGMKKILKSRGLTIDGTEIAPPVVTSDSARSGKSVRKTAGGRVATAKSSAVGSISAAKRKTTVRSSQMAGSKESEIDSGAYDAWLGSQ